MVDPRMTQRVVDKFRMISLDMQHALHEYRTDIAQDDRALTDAPT
eukprot:SAG31_NODE_42413_length_271_cov_1.802326_1_plen_44_part_01